MMTSLTTTEEKQNPSVDYGFPSHMIPQKKKDKKWCLQYIKAFHKEYTTGTGKILRYANEDYAKWRMFANGRQPIDPYKELMGVRKRKGKHDPSWLNLDWSILSVMPRIKAVVKNKILSQPYEITIKAVDQVSATEERMRRAEIIAYMADRQFLNEATQGLPFGPASPFEPGEPEPQSTREVDLYLQMFPKNRMALEMLDQVNLAMMLSDWKQIREEIVDNGFEVDIAGTKAYIDNRGVIRLRGIVPERVVTNVCSKKDFSDLIRIAEYIDITISELRQRVPRGTFTEAEYAQMAHKSSGKPYLADEKAQVFYNNNNRFPYDHERITIMDAEWFSADDVATVIEQDEMGRMKMIKKDDPYWLQKQGITDQQYMDFNKAKGSERTLIRDSVNNVYRGCWIVGTEFIFDYGLQNNMIRAISSLNDCELGYTLYTNFGGIMERVVPLCNNMQQNWLQYQHLTAMAKPPGIAIERRAVTQVTLGSGRNAITLGPEDILKQYAETGSYIYVGTDQNGKPYPYDPIKELKGGTSEQAAKCLENVLTNIELIRGVVGLNEFTDATSPDARANKDILNEAVQNSNNALGSLVHLYTSIFERTAKKICLLVPDAEAMGYNPGKIEALGELSHDYMKMNLDRNFTDFSLKVELGITQELRQVLNNYIAQYSKSAQNPGGILPEDAWVIQNENNIHRAYLILAQKRKQREAEEHSRQMELMAQQSQGNAQVGVMVEQAKQQTIQMQAQATIVQEQMKAQTLLALEERRAMLQMMIAKEQRGADMTMQEKEIYASLVEKQLTIMGELKKTKMQVDGQIAAVKAKPAPKPASGKK